MNVSTGQTFDDVSLCEGHLHEVHPNSQNIENYLQNYRNISKEHQPYMS